MQRMNEQRSTDLENKPLGDLFGDLASEMSNLVRQEVALARVEISQKAKYAGRNIGYLVVGGAVAYAALLAVLAAVIMLLDKVMPAWGAALLVGVVVAAIGWLLIGKAMSALQQMEVTPRETVETLKEDAAWMKQQIK
ncbi:MAG TPA: phage holin family protein [Pyrinomonadaceae bacterium]|nr:phage holin family protein [Pyrinomonadaceae bacterium]